jgi:hypothetical protein
MSENNSLYICRVESDDEDDVVGIAAHGQMILIDPRVAVEVAQSLMWTAMEIDPTMDIEQVQREYLASGALTGRVHRKDLH